MFLIKTGRSPWLALLWSVTIPGFGQLYNRDYLIGLVLITLEFIINVKADLNLVILHSFRGDITQACQVVNLQWCLFYPCVYSFSMWHAFNEAAFAQGSQEARLNGVFLGMAMVGTLGVIYSGGIGPVFTGIIGGAIGALLGAVIEYLIKVRKK